MTRFTEVQIQGFTDLQSNSLTKEQVQFFTDSYSHKFTGRIKQIQSTDSRTRRLTV